MIAIAVALLGCATSVADGHSLPDGFRTLRWGQPKLPNMAPVPTLDSPYTLYYIPGEEHQWSGIRVLGIAYAYYAEGLCFVRLLVDGEEFDRLKNRCNELWGQAIRLDDELQWTSSSGRTRASLSAVGRSNVMHIIYLDVYDRECMKRAAAGGGG